MARQPRRAAAPVPWAARHSEVLVAVAIAVLFHGGLAMQGSYARTYDAFVHIFLADHYARDWFSTWDTRWYTGFSTASYPPGVHQAIAALSPMIGLRASFVVVQVAAVLNGTIGVYRWAQIWVSRQAAGYASIAFVLSTSLGETVHLFGQLPTTFALGFLLQSLPFAYRWVRTGSRIAFVAGVTCAAATTAGHHVTTLMGGVFFLGPVLLIAVIDQVRTPAPDETAVPWGGSVPLPLSASVARRARRALRPLSRAVIFGVAVGTSIIVVVLPYWLYSASDPILQVAIPHGSRDSFLENTPAGLIFWLVPWGLTLIVLPYAFVRGLVGRTWPLALALALATLLGTGGTTPLPKILLGPAFDILTLDRFTFWATILVLPWVGLFTASLTHGTLRRFLAAHLGATLATTLALGLACLQLATLLLTVNLSHYRPFQPEAIDMRPIVAFLDKDQHDRWRYLTLGFGDQMAWLGAQTTAATVDGNYHSARRLPELTERPVERLEGAKYSGMPGIGSLQQFLAVPERYSLKYVFVADSFYNPVLQVNGWVDLGALDNGIEIWEHPDVAPLIPPAPQEIPMWQRAMWGILPPTTVILALMVLLWTAAGQPLPVGAHRIGQITASISDAIGPRRLGRSVDTMMARGVSRLAGPHLQNGTRDSAWTLSNHRRNLIHRMRRRSLRASTVVSARRRRIGASMIVAVLILSGLGLVDTLVRKPPPGPQDVIFSYYDDLDFRRFDEAYDALDPLTRPSFAAFNRELNRDGGLIASFAKLDSLHTFVRSSTSQSAVVTTTAIYLTALGYYRSRDTWQLVRANNGEWVMRWPDPDPTQPPEQLLSRKSVRYVDQERRGTGDVESTRPLDVLDRPRLALSSVRTILVEGRWTVIGQVTNIDTDPAYVTVSADFRDSKNNLLVTWNADQVIKHQLLPGEQTAFRIEAQSLATVTQQKARNKGAALHVKEHSDAITPGELSPIPSPGAAAENERGPLEFDPSQITPLNLPTGVTVGSVSVVARAVVTTRDLGHGLDVISSRVTTDPETGGALLTTTVRNNMPDQVAVPHFILSYLDGSGAVRWVDHAFLPHSIASQREVTFSVPLSTPKGIVDADVPTTGYDDALRSEEPTFKTPIALPASTGFSALRIQAFGYVRGSAS